MTRETNNVAIKIEKMMGAIQNLDTNVQSMRHEFKGIHETIGKNTEKINDIDKNVAILNNYIKGNGTPGLIDKVDLNTNFRNQCEGMGKNSDSWFGKGKLWREKVHGDGHRFYRWLQKNNYPKNNFRILCFNCNVAKYRCGICPHKLNKDELIKLRDVNNVKNIGRTNYA